MPSILPGFEYDIFVSYRQKDNKYDGWVTEFVTNLKKELEATFKEDVSIYFDTNPHDGLLETHQVDKSLEGKLKCLIFIPIISQTYCDPKSFAWEHEFCAFNKIAKEDQFGRDIKLGDGNVASRILPIKIHDLDAEDKTLLENELGGVLRAVEFIFRSAGVNRPLRANEDHPQDNLNKTFYRDQINKVAIAVKELARAMKAPPSSHATVGQHSETASQKVRMPARQNRTKIAVAALLLVFTLAAIYFFFIRTSETLTASKSSLAIIPFRNNTGDESKKSYGVGIAMEVSTRLGLTKQFDFISSLQATIKYQQTDDSPLDIGKALGVTHILSGLYQTAGDNIQVTVELIDATTGKVAWNLPYRTRYDDIFELQANIATKVLEKFSITNHDNVEPPTQNVDAYDHYMKGHEILIKSILPADQLGAIPELQKAIALDSGFLAPWQDIINIYGYYYINLPGDTTVTMNTVEPYIAFVENNFTDSRQRKNIQAAYNYFFLQNLNKAQDLFKQVLDENPQDPYANGLAATIARRKLTLRESLPFSLSSIRQSPTSTGNWNELRSILILNGDVANSKKAILRIYNLNKNLHSYLYEINERTNSLEELPDSVKKVYGKQYQADLLLQNRDYASLLAFADSTKFDSIFTVFSKNYYKTVAHYLLGQDNEATHYARLCLESGKQNDRLFAIFSISLNRFNIINSILGKEKDVQARVDLIFSRRSSEEDLQTHWNRKAWKLTYYVLSKNYPMANVLLAEMNRDYPQIGEYNWLNLPLFDRIKKEYPPFLETISQLKYPPRIMEGNPLKW